LGPDDCFGLNLDFIVPDQLSDLEQGIGWLDLCKDAPMRL
jgi:hypothetical protein